MIRRIICGFSTKKTGFFWQDINARVKDAQYAVRGLVPTIANSMKADLLNGSTSKLPLI
jgi:hypothetical protein